MLTVDQFQALNAGDLIEATPLLPMLNTEPVVLHCTQKNLTGDSLEFSAVYMGATIGYWTCTIKQGVLEWQTS